MQNPKNNPPLHGFSVATLLLLTVVVAIGAAGVRTLVVTSNVVIDGSGGVLHSSTVAQSIQNAANVRGEAVMRGIAGAMIGLLVGIGIGATRPRPVAGVLLGIFVGGGVGAFAGAVLAEPKNLPVAAIGAALLLLLGIVVRVFSSRPHGT